MFECPKTENFSSGTSSPSGKPGVQRASLLLATREGYDNSHLSLHPEF